MAEYDPTKTTTGNLNNDLPDYNINDYATDSPDYTKEITWDFPDAKEHLGYYHEIPEVRQSVMALARWTAGKGYEVSENDRVILDKITGWGEDSFQSILMNLIVMKKVCGDAFAEIIRNEKGTLINLKPISPERVKVVVGSDGLIKKYKIKVKKGADKTLEPQEMLHLCNNRMGDEIHGTSFLTGCTWAIKARQKAMEDLQKMVIRTKAVGVLKIKTDDTSDINHLKTQIKDAIKDVDMIVMPDDIGEIQDANFTKVPITEILNWIKYLENIIYQNLGIPKVILGGAQEFTEAGSKGVIFTFEQVYITEQTELEADLWNQLAIRVKFNKPTSLKDEMQTNEAKNTGQVGFQPKETSINMQRE